MKRFSMLGLSLSIAAAGAAESSACSRPCKTPSVEEAFAEAELVFYGTVEAREDKALYDRLTLKVTKLWKGAAVSPVTLTAQSTTCDPMGDMAKPGDRYLVFAAKPRYPYERRTGADDELVTGLCRGSIGFQSAKDRPHAKKLKALAKGGKR